MGFGAIGERVLQVALKPEPVPILRLPVAELLVPARVVNPVQEELAEQQPALLLAVILILNV